MKNLTFFLSLLLSTIAVAQRVEHTELTDLRTFPHGEDAIVFATQCKLREKPDTTSKVLDKLFIGKKVEVMGESSETLTVNGVERKWIKVVVNNKIGYVWGGNLSPLWFKLSNSETLIAGITHVITEGENSKYFGSLRIVNGDFATSIKDFEMQLADMPENAYLNVLSGVALDSVKQVIIFQTDANACGVFASEHHFLNTHKGLFMVGSGYSMGDAGVMHTSKSYSYPIVRLANEEEKAFFVSEGMPNAIRRSIEIGGYNDECEYETNYKVISFLWNGSKLEKICDD